MKKLEDEVNGLACVLCPDDLASYPLDRLLQADQILVQAIEGVALDAARVSPQVLPVVNILDSPPASPLSVLERAGKIFL